MSLNHFSDINDTKSWMNINCNSVKALDIATVDHNSVNNKLNEHNDDIQQIQNRLNIIDDSVEDPSINNLQQQLCLEDLKAEIQSLKIELEILRNNIP